MKTTTIARALGTAYGYTRYTASLIDWSEVQEIAIKGIKVLIVMTLLAGRATRQAWESLIVVSERLGKAYARLLVGFPSARLSARLSAASSARSR